MRLSGMLRGDAKLACFSVLGKGMDALEEAENSG